MALQSTRPSGGHQVVMGLLVLWSDLLHWVVYPGLFQLILILQPIFMNWAGPTDSVKIPYMISTEQKGKMLHIPSLLPYPVSSYILISRLVKNLKTCSFCENKSRLFKSHSKSHLSGRFVINMLLFS